MIKLLWAMDKNNLIGKGNCLPWNIREELQHFKKTTFNKTILLGRLTFEGIGKLLNNRKIIVLTRNYDYKYLHDDVKVVYDSKEIIDKYKDNLSDDIFICGGLMIYKEFLPYADELIISFIDGNYCGDKYFPSFNFNEFKLYKIKKYSRFTVKFYKKGN